MWEFVGNYSLNDTCYIILCYDTTTRTTGKKKSYQPFGRNLIIMTKM